MSVAANCKIGGRWWCCTPSNNTNSTKFQLHKSIINLSKAKPNSDICKFRCFCSSSFSRFSVSKKYHSLDSPDRNLLLSYMYDEDPYQIITVTIMVPDNERVFKVKLDLLLWKLYFIYSKWTRDIIKDEIVPLLLKNAHLWISSRLMLSSNFHESALKVMKSDQIIADKVTLPPYGEHALANAPNTIRCNEVIVDIQIRGLIDYKYKEIRTRDDLKALLHYLISEEPVMYGMLRCRPALLFKEKMQASEDYTHTTV